MKERGRVLVYPGWESIPHYHLLYRHLENIDYSRYHGAFFSLARNLSKGQSTIHIHWTADYFAVNEKRFFHFLFRYFIALVDIFWVRKIKDVHIVWSVHNLYAHESLYPKFEKFARIYLGKMADAVIGHSASAKPIIHREFNIPNNKISVIEIGPYTEPYENTISREEARAMLNIRDNQRMFLFFGGKARYKGAEHLLTAFDKAKSANDVLVMSGKNISSLKGDKYSNGDDSIRFDDGFVPDNKLQVYLNAADWVILPYTRILTSASLVTAMGFKKAVIIPDLGSLPDYVHPKGGIIYRSSEKDGLRKAIEGSHKIDPLQAGLYNFEKSSALSWEKAAFETEKIYLSLNNE